MNAAAYVQSVYSRVMAARDPLARMARPKMMPMIECPHCGTQNETTNTRCQECGQTLNEPPEEVAAKVQGSEALPPIPDGGLAEHMPDWLRTPLGAGSAPGQEPATDHAADETLPAGDVPPPTAPADNDQIDPRTFLTEADFPAWIRQLATPSEQRKSAPAAPWDEPWTAAPADVEMPSTRPEARPQPAVVVPRPALPPSQPETVTVIAEPAELTAPLPPPHRDWGRIAGLLVVILIVLAIGLVIILASTNSLP